MAKAPPSKDGAPAPTRGFSDLPLFWKLLTPFFGLMLVLGVLGAFVIVRDLSSRAKSQLDQELVSRSLDVKALIHERELYLLESANFAANLQGMPQAIQRADGNTAARLLQSVLALKTDLNVIAVADTKGRTIAHFTRERARGRPARVEGASWEGLAFIDRAMKDPSGTKTFGFLLSNADNLFAIAAPVCTATSPCAAAGVTVVGIKADTLAREALAAARSPGTSFGLSFYDSSGKRIAGGGLASEQTALPKGIDERPVARITEIDGRDVETLYASLELQARRVGTIAVTTETGPAFASVRGTGIRLGFILLGAMAGIVAIGALLSRAILKQLRALVVTNRALGAGKLSARVPVMGNDELGEVARGVNQMADQLQANIETLESRVEQRTQEIQRLLRERTEFFAGLSHELRTPLAVILNQSQMLRDPTFRKTRAALEDLGYTIGDSAEQLLTVVNEILELAKAELGGIELRLEELNLGDMLRQVRGTIAGLASAADLKLKVQPSKRLPPVRADRERMRQILLNLVDNAVKYTPPGGTVELSAGRRNGEVTVSVTDSGVGIPPEVGSRIFEPFFRVPGTRAQRGQASTGLGLALTKRLVEAHGGEIWFTSEPEKGTTFNVTIPAAPSSKRRSRARA